MDDKAALDICMAMGPNAVRAISFVLDNANLEDVWDNVNMWQSDEMKAAVQTLRAIVGGSLLP